MVDLLKEQIYHGNMISSVATPDVSGTQIDEGLQNCAVTLTTNMESQDAIMTQLSLLQKQLASQHQKQSQQLNYSLSEVRKRSVLCRSKNIARLTSPFLIHVQQPQQQRLAGSCCYWHAALLKLFRRFQPLYTTYSQNVTMRYGDVTVSLTVSGRQRWRQGVASGFRVSTLSKTPKLFVSVIQVFDSELLLTRSGTCAPLLLQFLPFFDLFRGGRI